tara:strand:+ start:888 stop:1025 length:138 start_codon:yes stop_codon:yes gene_type:complete
MGTLRDTRFKSVFLQRLADKHRGAIEEVIEEKPKAKKTAKKKAKK